MMTRVRIQATEESCQFIQDVVPNACGAVSQTTAQRPQLPFLSSLGWASFRKVRHKYKKKKKDMKELY